MRRKRGKIFSGYFFDFDGSLTVNTHSDNIFYVEMDALKIKDEALLKQTFLLKISKKDLGISA